MIDLKVNPFFLSDEDIVWVRDTLDSMTDDEKIGQLFCLIHRKEDDWQEEADAVLKYRPAGTQFRPLKSTAARDVSEYYQANSKIPMFIAANLERGGSGIVTDGTNYACNMQVAATEDKEMAHRQGVICGKEANAVGCNWAFAPCVDIDYNFRNPITNTRTYGSDPELVAKMGTEYVKAVQDLGVAASIKHFPGDGRDERDQHLVTTVNDMSCDEWDKTYGKIYQTCIEAGALTVMPGHIAHPEYSRKLRPGIRDDEILPATLSSELLNDLLREQLGFNGLIVSDATTMVGMQTAMSREKAVPRIIAAGCDLFLFARNLEEDYGYMKKGIETGEISQERLNEALTRILATKAALGLHKKQEKNTLVPPESGLSVIGCDEHRQWTRECANKAVTLIKHDRNLPMNPATENRVLMYVLGDEGTLLNGTSGKNKYFKRRLEDEGFTVDVFEPSSGMELLTRRYDEMVRSYDKIIYFCAVSTRSNQTTTRIEWAPPLGANCPIYVPEIPTFFISMENPYHLLDVPRVRNYINAYTNSEENVDAVIDKLLGRSDFHGKSPVDAFCGRWDTHL